MEDSLMNLELDKFNNDSVEFIKIYQEYSNKNVKVLGENKDPIIQHYLNKEFGFDSNINYTQVEIFGEIPKTVLTKLYDLIKSFVQICETHGISSGFDEEETSFLSAAKCIDNIIKHIRKDNSLKITDFIKPSFYTEYSENARFRISKDGFISIPIQDIDYRLGSEWVEFRQEIIDGMKNKSHFPDYDKCFKGKDVCDTVISMHTIIKKYIK
jgi:hypothetical protein